MAKFYSVSLANAQYVDGSNSSTHFSRFGQVVISSSSKLVGKVIGQVDVWVSRTSTSVTGTAYCRIRKGSDDSIACEIGSLDVSTIVKSGSTPSSPTTFGPNNSNTYALQVGDKILIEYSGGNSSNYLRCGDSGSGNTPYESGSNSRSEEYWSSNGYFLHNNPRDWAANFWDAVGGGTPTPGPTPQPPSPPSPTSGYTSNTAKDIAGQMWSIGTGTGTAPPPSPPPMTAVYTVFNVSGHHGRFLSASGAAGSSTGYLRIGEEVRESDSKLIGVVVNRVDAILEKIGTPTGTLTVNIRNGKDLVVATMGTLDVSTMSAAYNSYTFINSNNNYKLKHEDIISVEYNDHSSNSKNYIGIDENPHDPFDGDDTSTIYYTTGKVWETNTSKDICLTIWTSAPADDDDDIIFEDE